MFASQKLSPELTLELASSVSSDSGGHTKTSDPPADEGVCHSLRGDVGHGKGLRPSGELVDTGEQIRESPGGRQRADNVKMYLLEAGIWNW